MSPNTLVDLPDELLVLIFVRSTNAAMLQTSRRVWQTACGVPNSWVVVSFFEERLSQDGMNMMRAVVRVMDHYDQQSPEMARSRRCMAEAIEVLVHKYPVHAMLVLPHKHDNPRLLQVLGTALLRLLSSSERDRQDNTTLLRRVLGHTLIAAAGHGHVKSLRQLLKIVTDHGWTLDDEVLQAALRAAVDSGHLNVVQCLVTQGVSLSVDPPWPLLLDEDANEEGDEQLPPSLLEIALERRHRQLVQYMVRRAGGPQMLFNGGSWVLEQAAVSGDVGMFRMLLKEGFRATNTVLSVVASVGNVIMMAMVLQQAYAATELDVNHVGNIGNAGGGEWSPIMRAVRAGSPGTVLMLKEHGAHLTPQQHTLTLQWAIRSGSTRLVKVLLKLAEESRLTSQIVRDLNHAGILLQAADLQDTKYHLVATLMKVGVTQGSSQVLHQACTLGDVPLAKVLVRNCPELDLTGFRTNRPLLLACRENHIDMVQFLLAQGVDPNLPETGMVLKEAMMHAGERCVRLLIDCGGARETIAVVAASLCDISLCHTFARLLMHQEHNLSKQDLNWLLVYVCQRSPWLSVGYSPKDFVGLLLVSGADPTAHCHDALLHACRHGCVDTVSLLLRHGADPTARNGQMLCVACERGHLAVIRELLDACSGTPPRARTSTAAGLPQSQANWALLSSVKCRRLRVARLLLDDVGANPDCLNGRPLQLACDHSPPDLQMAELLLSRGCTVTRMHLVAALTSNNWDLLSALLHAFTPDVDDDEDEDAYDVLSQLLTHAVEQDMGTLAKGIVRFWMNRPRATAAAATVGFDGHRFLAGLMIFNSSPHSLSVPSPYYPNAALDCVVDAAFPLQSRAKSQ